MLEIEQKYRIAAADVLKAKLAELKFTLSAREEHVDWYLRHPSRDFAASGEALRVRQVNGQLRVTYKGKRHDAAVKIRPEIELPLGGSLDDWLQLWRLLGFEPVRDVRKRREVFVHPDNVKLVVAVDVVEGLGEFAELELLWPEQDDSSAAVEAIQALAARLELTHPEPRSYLRQLLGEADTNPKR